MSLPSPSRRFEHFADTRIPDFLLSIEDPRANSGGVLKGCPICGGLGHGLTDCPKLEEAQRRTQNAQRSNAGAGGY